MLISFSVENFRSFGEEATLNLVASGRLENHQNHRVSIPNSSKHVLRAAVLYGANAAGKSNLVKAVETAQDYLRGEVKLASPFRFDPSRSNQPSSFEFRFLLQDRVFIYGFDITSMRIDAEWLGVLKGEEEVAIFDRHADGATQINPDAKRLFQDDVTMFTTLDALKSLPMTGHQLFLNRASSVPVDSQGKVLSGIIRWLTEDLTVIKPDHQSCDILDRLQSDTKFRTFVKTFFQGVGTGVADLQVVDGERPASDWERKYLVEMAAHNPRVITEFMGGCSGHSDARFDPNDSSRILTRTLVSSHVSNKRQSRLPFHEESEGTQNLLHLMPVICPDPERSKVVIIDELDRSLHPLLCWEFIRFFSESCPGARRQMIVTTHEAHLLDQELLRRDEYWFVEKDSAQQSQLVSLAEFNIRKDLQIQKGYLQGRFGAIPVIGGMDSLERLLNCDNPSERGDATTEATP